MKQLSDYNFFSPEVLECPYEFYKLAREHSPVMELPSELGGGKLFLVTSYDLVKQILLNVEVFSSHFFHLLAGKEIQSPEVQEIAAQGWPPVNTLLTADPPEHERCYLNEVIEQRRKQPDDDLITDLVQAKVEGQRPLDTAELISIIQQLLVAGNETITNALAGGMLLLIQNPQQMALVQETTDRLENLVEEILRLETPTAGMWRIVKQDTELAGVKIPEGSVLLLRFDAANRDSKIFADGEHFEVDRSNAVNHLAFSHGIHFCVGAALARKEMVVAYEQLLNRLQNIQLAVGKK